MFTSFLKIMLRNLYREKLYALINVSGLSIAIACCIILGLWLRSELTYDRHNTRHREIYRAVNEFTANGRTNATARTSYVLGPMLAENYPQIKGFVRIMAPPQKAVMFRHDDKAFYWEKVYNADDNVFDVFSHDIIYGDPKTALVDPSSIAVSETFAKKYFGDANPIGESIESFYGETYKISLVFADLPENSHLKYDALGSFNAEFWNPGDKELRRQVLWESHFTGENIGITNYTYLVLPEDYNLQDFKVISDSFYAKYMADAGETLNATWTSWLQPLADIHLHSNVGSDLPTANKPYLYAFTAVAVFILLVACINYMNLTTARAAKRAKEVGMQKILGSARTHLMLRFLLESILFALIALVLGLVLVKLAFALTPIGTLLEKPMSLDLLGEPGLLGWMIGFALLIGLLSGSYPAFYLSSIMPLPSLVSGLRAGRRNIQIRHLLVLIQFTISVGVIACTLLMALQMKYVSGKPLGFEKENRVLVTLRGNIINKIPTITKELSKNSRVLGITPLSTMISRPTQKITSTVENNDGVGESVVLNQMMVGDNFMEVMGMQLAAGRNFSKRLLTDIGTSFVVNEALVKKMGWNEPLGKRIQLGGMSDGRVVGVVKDFHFASLHSTIEPLVLQSFQSLFTEIETDISVPDMVEQYLVLSIAGEDISNTLGDIEAVIMSFGPTHPYPYTFEFLDDALDSQYVSERRLMKLTGIFAGICILISCLGLFALSAFTTEERTREIGIRKVLGASTGQIILLLFRKILYLILFGAVVASLVAYYAVDEWLTSFAYRIDIPPWVFLLSAAVTACVAFATVASQSYKTARANPVNALRYE